MLLVLLFQDERNEMEKGRKKKKDWVTKKEQKPLVQGLFQSSDQLDQSGLWTPSTPLNHWLL